MKIQKNTHRKVTKYKFSEEKSSTVEERPFMPLPTLHLDLTQRYSYADYLTWFDDVRRELIDGFIHLMSGPIRIHQRVSFKLSKALDQLITKYKGKCEVYYAPFDVCLPNENEKDDQKIFNVVQPDIIVVCDLLKLEYKRCIGAPDLVVEVTSPSSLKKDWNYKFNLYEKAGVKEYWIVNPKAKLVNVFILQSDGCYDNGTEYEDTQKVPVFIFNGLEIDLKKVFDNEVMR